MTEKSPLVFLDDIVEVLSKIELYTQSLAADSFSQNDVVVDAVIRNLEILGEAANNLPEEITQRHPEIPWAQMVGLRNLLIHEYFGIDTSIIWAIVSEDLPGLKEKVQNLLNELEPNT